MRHMWKTGSSPSFLRAWLLRESLRVLRETDHTWFLSNRAQLKQTESEYKTKVVPCLVLTNSQAGDT